MKIISFILSLLIFSQSLSVCSPAIAKHIQTTPKNSCKIDNIQFSEKSTHKCCSSNKEEKEDKGCCGDNCKCFCCAHIVVNIIQYYNLPLEPSAVFSEKNMTSISVHSFDFHPSISYPPQIFI